MKKTDLNVSEILAGKDPAPERRDQKHSNTKKAGSQGSSAPDWLFHGAIEKNVANVAEESKKIKSDTAVAVHVEKQSEYVENQSKQGWKKIIIEAGVVFLIVLLIFNFVISVSRISGDSMQPNFCDGDRIVTFQLARNFEKGDVIVFKTKKGEKLIKRVIATEGDIVDISKTEGGLYINGVAANEDYIYTTTSITDESVEFPVTVGKDCLFVLGDNRTNSKDSRMKEIGLIKKDDVIGRVILDIKGV